MANWRAKKSRMYFHVTKQKYKEASHHRCAHCNKLTNFLEGGSGAPFIVSCISRENGKTRLIDDGKRGGDNQWAAHSETVHTIGVDLIPAIADLLICKMCQSVSPNALLEWMDLHLGTDDLPDAFQGCPVHASDQRAVVSAVWSRQVHGWRFGVMNGCP